MSLQNELSMCHEITPARLDRFTSLIDPTWIEQALHATGTASLRRRRLPAVKRDINLSHFSPVYATEF